VSFEWVCNHCGTHNYLPADTCFHCFGLRTAAPDGTSSAMTRADATVLAAQVCATVVAALASGFALSRLLGL